MATSVDLPKRYLRNHDLNVATVVRVWSPGESDFGHETFLWLDEDNLPWTSVIFGEKLVSRSSWDVFNPALYV